MPIKVRRIDFSPDEWIAGTVGLTLAEEGLYMRACALIYSRGGPITIDELKLACPKDHGNSVNACLKRLVALHKLLRNGREIDQKRCRFELEKARKRIGKARQNGAKGGRPNGLAKPDGFADEKLSLTTNYQPSTKEEAPPTTAPPKPEPTHRPAPDGTGPTQHGSNPEKSNARRGTRLPADWQPSPADRAFAQARGLDPGEIADQFADYWQPLTGAKAVKLDWSATYRNWCRRSRQPAYTGGNGSGALSIAAALSRVRLAGED